MKIHLVQHNIIVIESIILYFDGVMIYRTIGIARIGTYHENNNTLFTYITMQYQIDNSIIFIFYIFEIILCAHQGEKKIPDVIPTK